MADKQPNYKALCLITACLEAARIKYRMELGEAHDFVLQKLDGNEMKVRVADDSLLSVPEIFDVSAQVLKHGDPQKVNEVFLKLTTQAGYKCRPPINRGVTPTVLRDERAIGPTEMIMIE
jgi:hypothetical protein